MKTIAASIIALAIFAATATVVARSIHQQRGAVAEQCIGLSCWPDVPPPKQIQLPPVW